VNASNRDLEQLHDSSEKEGKSFEREDLETVQKQENFSMDPLMTLAAPINRVL
jgi:hypothetical protein